MSMAAKNASALTECNHCYLLRVRRHAPKGARVIVKPHGNSRWPNSVDVFVVPAGVNVDVDELVADGKHHRCWFIALSEVCECC